MLEGDNYNYDDDDDDDDDYTRTLIYVGGVPWWPKLFPEPLALQLVGSTLSLLNITFHKTESFFYGCILYLINIHMYSQVIALFLFSNKKVNNDVVTLEQSPCYVERN